MSKKITIILSIIIIVLIIFISYFLFNYHPKIKDVNFIAEFTKSEDYSCSYSHIDEYCAINLTFIYKDKIYVVTATNRYFTGRFDNGERSPEDKGNIWLSTANYGLNESKFRIVGQYDSSNNHLLNYTAYPITLEI